MFLEKKGKTMRALVWCLALCVVVTGVSVASADGKSDSAKAAEKKFDIPIWHPDARWGSMERYLGSGASGNLDGPASQVMGGGAPGASSCFVWTAGGPYCFGGYDKATEMVHTIAGNARGYLDGPLARARWGGFDYTHRGMTLLTPDRKRFFFTDPYNGGVLRQIDLVNRVVSTVNDIALEKGVTIRPDSKGQFYTVSRKGLLKILSPDLKKIVRTQQLEVVQKAGLGAWSIAIDEEKNRLYAGITFTSPFLWYAWYWDLKDGSFHGLIPVAQKGEPKRRKFAPGPFKGVVLYPEVSVYFGLDDPEKRYLYLGVNDCYTFFRADLKTKEIWTFSRISKRKGGGCRFIQSGKVNVLSGYWGSGLSGHDVGANVPSWNGAQRVRWRRVK